MAKALNWSKASSREQVGRQGSYYLTNDDRYVPRVGYRFGGGTVIAVSVRHGKMLVQPPGPGGKLRAAWVDIPKKIPKK